MSVQTQANITVICDNPSCTRGDDGMPTVLTWVQEHVNENPSALPAGAHKIRTSASFAGDRMVLCSFECEIEWAQRQINPSLIIPAAAYSKGVVEFGKHRRA